ncbi:MAG: sensor histidine kinase [Chlorobiaceae bacterium]
MRRLLGGMVVMLVLLVSSRGWSAPLMLGERSSYELTGHMELLKDPSLRLGLAEVLKAAEAGRFRQLDGNLNNGYKREACWVRFTVERNASFPEEGLLRLKPNYINELTLYIQIPGKDPALASSYRTVLLGNHVPAPQRPVLNPDFVVPIDMPASTPMVVYARVFSHSSISLAGQMHTAEDLRDSTNRHVIMQSAFLGVTLTLLLINLIFYISVRDSLFGYYSLYLLAGLLFNFAAEGSLTLLFPSMVHRVSDYLIYGGIGANILVYSEFSRKLFFAVSGKWSLRYMRFLSLLGFLTIVAVPLGFYASLAPLAFIGILSLVVIQLVLSQRMLRNLPGIGIFIVIAFGISAMGYFHMLLRLMGVLPLSFLWDMNTVQFTSLVHMILISVALSERIRMSEKVIVNLAQRELEAAKETERKAVELANDMTTELRNSKSELEVALVSERQAHEQQHRFLSMLSHEYRTPLAVISANLDIIDLQESRMQCWHGEELTAMHHAVDRLVEVMDVSLERSRLTEPCTQCGMERMALEPFLSEKVELMRAMWPLQTFTYTEASELQPIVGDYNTLKTALFNLLDNARKYAFPGTPVDVESHIEGGEVVITIKNQANPIRGKDAEVLFDKYTRGKNCSDKGGAGVGLWLVRQIIGQHNGRVRLHSKSPHIIATVQLPLAESHTAVGSD